MNKASHAYHYRAKLLSVGQTILAATLLSLTVCACQPTTTNPPDTLENTAAATLEKPTIRASDSLSLYPAGFTAQQLTDRCDADLAKINSDFNALTTQAPPYTTDNFLVPLDRLYNDINNATGMTFLLNNVHPLEALQNAADACVQAFAKVLTEVGLSRALYERLTAVDTSEQDRETQRFQQRLVRDFQRAGVNQDETTQQSIRELNENITDLGQRFSKNIRSDVRTISFSDSTLLAGLPKDYIANHPADENGNITISTDYPDLFPFLRYAHDDQARKTLYQRYLNRGHPINDDVLRDIIEQRHKLARELGYDNFASYATEIMMVQNPDNVAAFIDRIDRLAATRAQEDYAKLLATLQQQNPALTEVGNWQKFYAEERVRRQQYNVDAKQVRQYFQYAKVKQGIFQLVEDLFSVEIKPWQTDVWDNSVETYTIWENGQPIGHFYLDMHPRDGKYQHAAQFDIQAGIKGQQLPVAALVCNFPGANEPHALMGHQQVETFLHEFGHLLHHIFSGQQQWGLFSGVSTERDFVEAPSQMLEEWIWDYDTLKSFAVNQQGEPIPRELVEQMHNARNFGRGTFIRNQMFYAALALEYYQTPPERLQLSEQMIALQERYSPFPYMNNTHFYTSFGHLYGYSAAYYTYMWSEVIAADILQEFKRKGMRNKALAKHYRDSVLAPGGSKDAAQLVADFLGRPFSFDAFIDALNKAPR